MDLEPTTGTLTLAVGHPGVSYLALQYQFRWRRLHSLSVSGWLLYFQLFPRVRPTIQILLRFRRVLLRVIRDELMVQSLTPGRQM